MAKMPGLLSVESNAGIVFSKEAGYEEIREHQKITENTYFKQKAAYDKKVKE